MRIMRVAILSDIHGNSVALDAVLDDIKQAGRVDAYWVLGDLAAMGPDPVGALERLNDLQHATYVRGNTDRYVCNLLDPGVTVDRMSKDPANGQTYASLLAGLCWTQGALTASGWLNWLATLELEQRLALPDGTRVLLVHAAPGTDDGAGLHPGLTPDQVAKALDGCNADLVFTGHTHWQLDQKAGATRLINPGSISVPWGSDTRASYYLLEASATSHTLTHRRVTYDTLAVVEQLKGQMHPSYDMLSPRLRGERPPPWAV
jgi:predicted phosphodiesterase